MVQRTALAPGEPIRVMRIIARLNVGGPAVHVALLTAALQNGPFHSQLITGSLSPGEGDMAYLAQEMGVEPVIVPSLQREIRLGDDFRALRDLLKLMRSQRPHIVHTHTAKAGFIGRLAAVLSGVPVIVHTFHGHVFYGYFGRLKTALFIALERLAALRSDVILAISERLKQDLVRYGVAPAHKIDVVPLGLNLAPYAGLEALRGGLRAELGCPPAARLVAIVGRLVSVKRHDLFLQAAQTLCADLPQARFVIIGDGELRAELEAEADRLGLRPAVTFLGWRRDLPYLYADLDAVVICSDNEGTPVSLIEAMAAGVPVIATAVGGVPDLLAEGQYGRLIAPGDAQALAEAIRGVLAADEPQRLSAARAYALERFSAERLAADLSDLYLAVLRRKGLLRPLES